LRLPQVICNSCVLGEKISWAGALGVRLDPESDAGRASGLAKYQAERVNESHSFSPVFWFEDEIRHLPAQVLL